MPGTINQIGNQILNNSFIIGDTNNNSGSVNDLRFQKSRILSAINAGDFIGSISFEGNDGNNFIPGALITAQSQATIATGIIPTKLFFGTASNASGGIVFSRMTIDSGGNVIILPPDSGIGLTISSSGSGIGAGGIKFPLNVDNRIYIGASLYEHSTSTLGTSVFLGLDSGNISITGDDNTCVGSATGNSITTAMENTCIGSSAGANIIDGSDNTCVGFQAGLFLTSGQTNTIIGVQSLKSLTTGNTNTVLGYFNATLANCSDNIIVGYGCLASATGTSDNIVIGVLAAGNLLTGIHNLMIGAFSGGDLAGAEASNILIQNRGVLGESNVMRLGTTGSSIRQVNKAFIAGTYAVAPTGPNQFVTINSSGQLGSVVSSIASYTNVTFGMSPYTVLSTDYYLSCDTSGGSITIKLPNAPTANTVYIIKDRTGNADSNNIVVTTVTGIVTIDGQAIYPITSRYQAISLLFNGTGYEIY